jgi:hypothetical protein
LSKNAIASSSASLYDLLSNLFMLHLAIRILLLLGVLARAAYGTLGGGCHFGASGVDRDMQAMIKPTPSNTNPAIEFELMLILSKYNS